jgi:hypothetical protein
MSFELNIKSWNMNFWMNPLKPKNDCAKNENEINEWINISRQFLRTNENINILLLQECSYRLYKPSFGKNIYDERELCNKFSDKEIRYIEIPDKGSRWGLINEVKGISITYFYQNNLSFVTCNYKLENNEIITIINLYVNNNSQKGYLWQDIIDNLNSSVQENDDPLIILAGDFNASEHFPHKGIENDKMIFQYLKNELGLIDCSENIPINERSTMIDPNYNDGHGFQNDYIFINKQYRRNERDFNINKDKRILQYRHLFDHYPLNFRIML